MNRELIFSDLNAGWKCEEMIAMLRKQFWVVRNRVGPFKNIARADVFEQQQQRDPSIDDKTFQARLPPQPLQPVQGYMFRLNAAAADFDGVKDERLRLRFEFKAPLRLMLH